MANITQKDKFELGTSCLISGMVFLTVLPVITNSLLLFVDMNAYRFFGALFILGGIIFYFLSPSYLYRQTLVVGANFVFYSLFQMFFAGISILMLFALFFGIIMIFYGYKLLNK